MVSRDGFHTRTIAIATPLMSTVMAAATATKQVDRRAQQPERRLGLNVGPGGLQDRLPGADRRPPTPGTTARRSVSPNAPAATISPTANHSTSTSTVIAKRLEGFFAPQGQHRAQAAASQHRGQRDGERPGDLPVRHAAQQGRQQEHGQGRRQHHQHAQQAGQQLAQHQLACWKGWSAAAGPACGGLFRGPLRWPPAGRKRRSPAPIAGGRESGTTPCRSEPGRPRRAPIACRSTPARPCSSTPASAST